MLSSDPETTVDIVDTAPDSDTAFEAEFGPRARTLDQFAEVIDPGRALTETERENLFSCSAGRVKIARALLGAAERAGIRLSDIDAPRVDALLPPELTPHRSGDAELPADIYLLLLFSWPRRITSTLVDLIHSALTLAEADAAGETPTRELISRLVAAGLLRIEHGDEEVFSVPPLIRALMRRVVIPSEHPRWRSPRQAFALSLENLHGRLRAEGGPGLDEALALIVDIENWDLLEQLWTRRSLNIFGEVDTAVDAYLAVPEEVISRRPILALARSAARLVDSTRRRLGTDEGVRVLPRTDFDRLVLPGIRASITGRDAADLTADEVAVLTTLEARELRVGGDVEAALTVIGTGREHLRERAGQAPGISQMIQAELNLEHGHNLVTAGRFPEALQILQRVVQYSETYTPNSWHPMLEAQLETALAGVGHGRGAEVDRSFALAREQADSFGMDVLPDEPKAQVIAALRSLDRLDLAAAERALGKLRSLGPVPHLGALPALAESLCNVYVGRSSIAAKELTENAIQLMVPVTNPSTTPFSGIVNLVGFVFLAAGEAKLLQELVASMNPSSPGYALTSARQGLMFGRRAQLWNHTGPVLSGGEGPRLKASAAALRTTVLHQEGRGAEAVELFGHVLDYCTIASTVTPLTQLSRQARIDLIAQTADAVAWTALAATFSHPEISAAELQQRLLDLPETLPVTTAAVPELSSAELSLLVAIDSDKSIPRIASDYAIVTGSLKNRLSALYKKLGVRSRDEAVAYGHRNGYL
ncbi:hypothetical protein ACH82I_08125 [Brevibacterium sp. GP-SGM9]|uniref:hypothetical protein n=1 Tax=Brevibacterium sp. GP-SGM9 TaxID=3376990 RepID=UPI0039A63509